MDFYRIKILGRRQIVYYFGVFYYYGVYYYGVWLYKYRVVSYLDIVDPGASEKCWNVHGPHTAEYDQDLEESDGDHTDHPGLNWESLTHLKTQRQGEPVW